MQRRTRKPSGRPSWPFILLAGVEGAGKTWAAAQATGMPGARAYVIEIGEGSADEYINVPGASYEIVEHDGTVDDILDAVRWVAAQPVEAGEYPLLVVDSITELWTLITDEAQAMANQRAARKRARVQGDAQITMDLWSRAKDRMTLFWAAARAINGPVLFTARLDLVTVMDDAGRPTGDKDWKIRCHKDAPFYMQAIVQARQPQRWLLTKVASTRLKLAPGGEQPLPDFTVAGLLEAMGISVETTGERQFAATDPTGVESITKAIEAAEKAGDLDALRTLWKRCKDGEQDDLLAAIEGAVAHIKAAAAAVASEAPPFEAVA